MLKGEFKPQKAIRKLKCVYKYMYSWSIYCISWPCTMHCVSVDRNPFYYCPFSAAYRVNLDVCTWQKVFFFFCNFQNELIKTK